MFNAMNGNTGVEDARVAAIYVLFPRAFDSFREIAA